MKHLFLSPTAVFFTFLIFGLQSFAKTNLHIKEVELSACERVDRVINPYIEHGMFSGNLILAKNGQILCQKSAGFQDVIQQQPMNVDAQFPIASLSKPIVASLLVRLQELNKLDVNDTLDKYLPNFNAPWANQVTLHHLLSNRSGLANHFLLEGWGSGRYDQSLPHQDLLRQIAKMNLAFAPGTQYQYSNLGWLLLGEVVKNVTEASLSSNLKLHVFMPAGMTKSGLIYQSDVSLVDEFRWAKNGGWEKQKSLHMQVFNVGAGIYSTSEDLLRFLDSLHRGELLSPNSRALLFDSSEPYGWRIETIQLNLGDKKKVHSFDGQLNGYSSFVYQVLEENISLVLLNNSGMGYKHKQSLANDILNAYYGHPQQNQKTAPTLLLNRALLNNTWDESLSNLAAQPIQDINAALLVNDLAQQLEWSRHLSEAIDLYSWLVESFPDNQGLKKRLDNLCQQNYEYGPCHVKASSSVGMQVLWLEDTNRNAWRSDLPRPITTHMFYHTEETDSELLTLGKIDAPLFNAGRVVKNASPTSGKRPLVLLSHGTGGSAPQLLWLANSLVEAGYLVAGVNHHGNTAFESKQYPEGYLLWWERTQDLAEVKKQLLNSPEWKGKIDEERIAVVGFSLGGYTAVSALGGITNKPLFNQYCQNAHDDFSCQPQPEFIEVLDAFEKVKSNPQVMASNARQQNNYGIQNVKVAVAIAPAILHAFEPDSLSEINTPILFLIGSDDDIAPRKSNSSYAHDLLPNSQLHIIENAGHYSFLSLCTEKGKQVLSKLCENHPEITRQTVHEQAAEQVVSFLNQYLKAR